MDRRIKSGGDEAVVSSARPFPPSQGKING
jgi:hypothetical protein